MSRETIITSLSLPPDSREVLKWFDIRAKADGVSRSKLIYHAMREYRKNHWKGNPQTFLEDSPSEIPQFSDPHRDKAAINFLRNIVGMPIRDISLIVERSIGYIVKSLGKTRGKKRPRRTKQQIHFFRMNLIKYQEGFRLFMDGKKRLREAFKVE